LEHVHVWERIKILVMDLEETEARNYCDDESQPQFKQPPTVNEYFHLSHNVLYRFVEILHRRPSLISIS
jgi:hypothetical protein